MEKNVRLGCVVAWLLWGGAVVLTLGATIASTEQLWAFAFAMFAHAVLGMGAAATLTVRNLLERQNGLVHDAFEMGREIADVRQIR